MAVRRLHSWGAHVTVHIPRPVSELAEVLRQRFTVLERLGLEANVANGEVALGEADLIMDALIGYSLRGEPTGNAATLIHAANLHRAPILALDVPSGLHSTTGVAHEPAIRATVTMTLALPKTGLRADEAGANVGELYLADIGVPPELYAEPTLTLSVGPIFSRDDMIRLS